MDAAIDIHDLRKQYGTAVALDGASFSVPAGEIFGLLGPNGAGKTTTVECLLGLRRPDGGTMRVLGMEGGPRTRAARARARPVRGWARNCRSPACWHS